MNAHSSQLGFTDYVAMVWNRRSTALFAAGLFSCITFIAFNFVPRKYAATCVFERRGNVISARTSGLPESFGSLKPLLSYHLTGNEAVRKALDDLGCFDTFEHDAHGDLTADAKAKADRLVQTVQQNLHTSWIIQQKNLDRLSLQLTTRDPQLTSAVPNRLVSNYIASTRSRLIGRLSSSATYLRQRIDEAQAEGDELREQRHNFLRAHPDMMPGNPQHLTMQIERTFAEIEDIQRQRKAAESRFGILQSLEAGGAVDTMINPEYVAAAESLQKLQQQLERHRISGKKDRHPKVAAALAQIAQTRAQLRSIPPKIGATGPGAPQSAAATMLRIENVRAELDRLAALEARKSEALKRYNKAQANFLPVARQYQQMSEQIAQIEAEQRLWQKNLGDVQMALAAERSGTRTNMEVVKAAGPVYRPTWPALWHVFVLAIGGGLAFGVSLVIVMSRLSRCFGSAEEARGELGLPVLGVVGPILSPAARRLRAIRRYALAPATVAVLMLITVLAAIGVVMSTHYPGRYAQILEHVAPTTQAMWDGVRSLLGLI